jgi:hypothetical protein
MSEYYRPLSIDVTHRRDAWVRDHGAARAA